MTSPADPASPSLGLKRRGDAPAHELKFQLDEAAAGSIEAWAHRHLQIDIHGDPALGGAYETTSLYL